MGLALKLGGLFDRGLGYAWAIGESTCGQRENLWPEGAKLRLLRRSYRDGIVVIPKKVGSRAHAGLFWGLFHGLALM